MRSVVLGCGNAASLENVSCVRKCCMRQKMLYASEKMLYASENAVCVSKCCMRQKMLYASAYAVCVSKCCMRQKNAVCIRKCCMRQQMLYASANAVCVRKMLYASANAVCVSKCCMRQRMQHASEKCCRCVLCRVGQNHTFIGIYGIFGREITILTVICGADIRFWPTLVLCNMHK